MTAKRALALCFFVATVIACVNLTLLRFPFTDLQRQHRGWSALPDAEWGAEYPRFLEEVRASTRPGDSILIVVPHGFSYAYFRANYRLAGREVLPFFTDDGRPIDANVGRVRYVAVWGGAPNPAHGRVVFEKHQGMLVER